MAAIYKYELKIKESQRIYIPSSFGKILSAGFQDNSLFLWAMVNPELIPQQREFCVFGTGQEFNEEGLTFIATVHQSHFVWHIFEREILWK